MAIRSACKAWIVKDGKVLLNKANRPNGLFYHELPGGGQNPYETMEEAVVRECLEETGYTVKVKRLLCVHESICQREDLRKKHPDYTHVIYSIFECALTDAPRVEPSEPDSNQEESVWVPLEEVKDVDFRPPAAKQYLLDGIDPQTIRHIPVNKWPD